MAANFRQRTVLQHVDAIDVADRREPVGDRNGGLSLHQDVDPLLDESLCLGVDGAGGLVENQNLGAVSQRPGEGEELALAGRKVRAPLAHRARIAISQGRDEFVRPDGPRRSLDGGLVDVAAPERDVVRHAAAEERDVLQHRADPPPEFVLRELAHVDTIHQDPSPGHVVEPRQQLDQGRLAGARRPHEGDLLARLHPEGQILEHPARIRTGLLALPLTAVAEPDVVEFHRPAPTAGLGERPGMAGVDDLRLPVQELEDPLGTRHRRLHYRVLGG